MVLTLGIIGMGPMELVIVAGIVLLLFGSRLPSVMRSLGQSVTSFKSGLREGEEDEKPVDSINEKKSGNGK